MAELIAGDKRRIRLSGFHPWGAAGLLQREPVVFAVCGRVVQVFGLGELSVGMWGLHGYLDWSRMFKSKPRDFRLS